jgi:ATP synthase subunit 6
MIYNQVLEQFGDWTLFWNSFRTVFYYPELHLDYFLDRYDRMTNYPDLYARRKQELESLLEEIGYKDVSLSSQYTTKEQIEEALIKRRAHRLTASGYELQYPHLLRAVDRYNMMQNYVRPMCGGDLYYVTSPLKWLLEEEYYFHDHRLYMKEQKYIMFKHRNDLNPLSGIEEWLQYYIIKKRIKFNLWTHLPLPKDKEHLEKELRLFFEPFLTIQKMEEAGVILSTRERNFFMVEGELRRLAPYRTVTRTHDYLSTIAKNKSLIYLLQGDAVNIYPNRAIRREDPSLTFHLEARALIECELLKRDFLRQAINSFFIDDKRDLPMFKLSVFLTETLRRDLVELFERKLDDYLITLHYHQIGLMLRRIGDGLDSVTTWKFTQFTYFLFLSLFLSSFFFFTRKIFYSGWWRGNVTIVSFLFNLVKEQANIRAILHLPLLLTVFLWILSNNLVGLLPFGYAITSHILFTFFLGFSLLIGITILIWQEKKKEMIQLFLPKGVPSFLVPFLFVIELISYLFRTVSLSVRLFANMMAGHALLHILTNFGVVISSISSPLRFFFIFPLVIVALITFLELGIALLQAYVFTVLLAIYLNDVYSLESH